MVVGDCIRRCRGRGWPPPDRENPGRSLTTQEEEDGEVPIDNDEGVATGMVRHRSEFPLPLPLSGGVPSSSSRRGVAGGAVGRPDLDLLRRVVGGGAPTGGCAGTTPRRRLVTFPGQTPGIGDTRRK